MSMLSRRGSKGGFTLLELAVAMLIIVILAMVVVLMVSGMFGGVRVTAMDTDLDVVKTAVDAYAVNSGGEWPTVSGKLPTNGHCDPIDFDASFTSNGKAYKFYPHYLAALPKHHEKGVWKLSSKGAVSIDMDASEY